MDEITNLVKDLITQTETVLNRGLDNVYITTAIKVFLGLYAGFAAPKLPPSVLLLMDNIIFRVGVAFMIVLVATRDPSIALMISVAFIITLQTANKYRLINTSLSVAAPGQTSWLPSAKAGMDNFVGHENPEKKADHTENPMDNAVPSGEEPYMPFHNNIEESDIEQMREAQISENFHNVERPFTTESQFVDAQSNTVPGSDQQSCVQTFKNQHCAQGLSVNSPQGAH